LEEGETPKGVFSLWVVPRSQIPEVFEITAQADGGRYHNGKDQEQGCRGGLQDPVGTRGKEGTLRRQRHRAPAEHHQQHADEG